MSKLNYATAAALIESAKNTINTGDGPTLLVIQNTFSQPDQITKILNQIIPRWQQGSPWQLLIWLQDESLSTEEIESQFYQLDPDGKYEAHLTLLVEQANFAQIVPGVQALISLSSAWESIELVCWCNLFGIPALFQSGRWNSLLELPLRILNDNAELADAMTALLESHKPANLSKLPGSPERQQLLQAALLALGQGRMIADEQLAYLLDAPAASERKLINLSLAKACLQIGDLAKASHFAERSWQLAWHEPEVFQTWLAVLLAKKDYAAVSAAYKALGLRSMRIGQPEQALQLFQASVWVYHTYAQSDEIAAHPDLTEIIELMATSKACRQHHSPTLTRRIRVAHLIHDISMPSSVMAKHTLRLIEHHNRDIFEVYCLVHQAAEWLTTNTHVQSMTRELRAADCEVLFAPPLTSALERMQALAKLMTDLQIDIMVTHISYEMLEMLYLTALKPAPLSVAACYGQSRMFSSSLHDLEIHPTRIGGRNGIVDTCYMRPAYHREDVCAIDGKTRTQLGLPEDAVILYSAGRGIKFLHEPFWQSIGQLLKAHPQAWFCALGIEQQHLPFWDQLPASSRERMRCLGWKSQRDAAVWLQEADVYLDTFPTGGGFTVAEAIMAGLPVVSFTNDPVSYFNPEDWRPFDEYRHDYLGDALWVAPHGDFSRFESLVSKLIQNPEQRRQLGEQLRDRFEATLLEPAMMARDFDNALLQLVWERSNC